MGKEVPIVVVHNATGTGKDATVKYLVRTPSISISKEIRDKFGFFFEGSVDKRPPEFKGISIRNRLTKGTHVRIALLRLFGQRYLASNPGAKIKVVGYQSRPLLKLFPPSGGRIQTFNFIEAVKRLPAAFSPAEVSPIIEKIDPKLRGQLRALFVVISDDQMKQKASRTRGQRPATEGNPSPPLANSPPPAGQESDGDDDEESSEASGDEAAAEVTVPPDAPPSSSSGSHSRSGKRGPVHGWIPLSKPGDLVANRTIPRRSVASERFPVRSCQKGKAPPVPNRRHKLPYDP